MEKPTLGKSTIYLFIDRFVFIVTGFAIHFFLGRYLGVEDYGIYGVVISLMTTINLILITGIPTAVSKFISENVKNAEYIKNKALKLQVISAIIIAVIYVLSASFIAYLLKDTSLVNYIRLSALIFPTYSLFAIYVYYFNGLQKFSKQAILRIIYSISKLFLVIILVFFIKVYGAILGFILAPLIAFIFVLLIKKEGYIQQENHIYKRIIKFALPIIIFSVSFNFLMNIDLWFVKSFLTNELTGFYTASGTLSKTVYMSIAVIAGIIFPAVSSSIASNNLERTKLLINQSLRYITIILLPLIVYFALRSKEIIEIVYGSEYIQASQSLSILVFGIGFITLFFMFATILNASNKPKKSMYIILLGLITSIILNYFLIPVYGLIGAAISTSVGGILILLISGISVKREFNLKIRKRFIFNILASLILSCLIILIFSVFESKYIVFPEAVLFFGVYFALLIFLFKELTKVDIRRVKEAIPFSSKFKGVFEFLEGKV